VSVGTDTSVPPSKGHAPQEEPEDDRLLVERLRRGDDTACDELLDRYGDRLFAMLLRLAGGDAEQAAEFTQEAFVRAYERLDRFDGTSRFYTWLYRLARNRALDLLARKRPVALDSEGLEAAAGSQNRAAADPGKRIEADERHAAVHAALDRLGAEQREIILLRDFEGLDYAEIAERLETAVGTVKSRLSRARAALRDELAERLGDL